MIVETLITEAMRLAEQMGAELSNGRAGQAPVVEVR